MTKSQRLILVVSILASFVAFLDGTVVNVALPAVERSLGGGLITQQWVVDAYLLTLGSLILIAGSLSDLFGRKLILCIGLIGFGITSILCSVSSSSLMLIIFRGLQGISGALIVPSSLALIISNFKGSAQGKAIGTWTAWTGISFIVGPLLGGLLVDSISWRAVFIINVIPISITLWLLNKIETSEKRDKSVRIDYIGALLCTVGLTLTVFSLIEQPQYGWSRFIVLALLAGLVCLVLFIYQEARSSCPMLPLSLFKIRNFSVGNLATVSIYAGLSVATFLIVIALQQLGHYSALEAGLALMPVTIIMFVLSPRFGLLAGKYGPRLFMSVGPIIAGLGFLLLVRVNGSYDYLTQILPGVLVFGFGLSMTVAPLTSAVLGHIPTANSGIGSAVNNAVSRIAGLLAIAVIGLIVGQVLTLDGFHKGIEAMAILLFIGGLISALGITNKNVAH